MKILIENAQIKFMINNAELKTYGKSVFMSFSGEIKMINLLNSASNQ